MPTVKEVLLGAIRLIEQGWGQGMYICEHGGRTSFCAEGAIRAWMTGRNARPRDEHAAVYDAARVAVANAGNVPQCRDEYGCLVHWNDAPTQTKENVLSAFRKAVENLEKLT